MTIEAYLEAIKERLVTDPMVTSFHVIRERATLVDGHLRARLTLADDSQFEEGNGRRERPADEERICEGSDVH
jgi:hypothetical protein